MYFEQIEKEGKDVTITAFSKMVGLSLKVCIFIVVLFSLLCNSKIDVA